MKLESIMKVKHSIVLVCILALSSFVMAQEKASVDGTWTGEVQGRGGQPQQLTLTLKSDGGKVTGTVGGGRGGPVTIEDGTVSGATVKFKTKQQGRGGEVTLNWAGTVKSDEIAFSRMVEGGQGQAQEFTLKKQK